MGTANSGDSAGIAQLRAEHGGASNGVGAGPYSDSQDRDLIWDREDRWPDKALPGDVRMMEQGGKAPTMPVIFKESHAEKHPYALTDRKELETLQRRLWAGGFYPPGTDPTEVPLGTVDPWTEKAWLGLVDQAAKYKNAGRDLTIWEILDEGANIRNESGLGGDASGSGRAPLVVELSNPEDLKYYAQKTAVGTLGRALRPDELERFVSSFHGSQRAAQTQAYGQAGGVGGSVVSAPNPTTAAESFARQAAPVEAGAHDYVRVFDAFSKMLGGRRNS